MTIPEEVAEWAAPDLAAEFADTLGRCWLQQREALIPLMPPEANSIMSGLESFVSTAFGAEVIWSPPSGKD